MAELSLGLNPIGVHSSPRGWRRHPGRASVLKNSNSFKCLLHHSSPKSPPQAYTEHLEADLITSRIEELKQGVKKELFSSQDTIGVMTSIDTIQHLGISYHFEEEISILLDRIYDAQCDEQDLSHTALCFRLLRQGGHNVSPDVFHNFMDKEGKFKDGLSNDLRGLLSLNEASHLGVKDELVLSQAKVFSKQHLNKLMVSLEDSLATNVGHALAFPRERRMEKSEARSYIEKHGKEYGRSSHLLELATLDFNMVQKLYQREIAELVSWWRDLGLAEKVDFARDRPLECFLWTVGIFPEPCFSSVRINVAKTVAILLVIDDVYDIYGSLDELVLFTDAIRRWGVDATEELPECMKLCYMALYNTTHEIGCRVLTEHGLCILPHLRKTWVDLCEAFLVEARRFRNGLVPSLEDYISNGVTTAGTYMALVHAFFLIGKQVTEESIAFVNSRPELFTSSGRILRLWDDLGTTKEELKRGDDASSIKCYMEESRTSSDDDARSHIRFLIDSSWHDLTEESFAATPLPRSIIRASLNLARTAQAVYQHGDDDRVPSTNAHIQLLLIKPIQHNYMSGSIARLL